MKKIIGFLLVTVFAISFGISGVALTPPCVTGVEISGEDVITLYVGDVITLEATADSNGVDFAYMLWNSKNPDVIEVSGDNGTTKFEPPVSMAEVRAVKPGTAVVTVYADASEVAEAGDYYEHDSATINVLPSPEALRNQKSYGGVYDSDGSKKSEVEAFIRKLTVFDGTCGGINQTDSFFKRIEVPDCVKNVLNDGEYFAIMDIRTKNDENPYPEIEKAEVLVREPVASGNAGYMGKNYRLFFAENIDSVLTDVSDIIKESSSSTITFELDRLGIYVLCFDPHVFNVEFYMDEPIFDDEYNQINPECVLFEKTENLKDGDTLAFPEVPEKEGFVFTGWKEQPYVPGGGSRTVTTFVMPQPVSVGAIPIEKIYASWCPVDEYEPIEIGISSEEPLVKGKEDSGKIILKTNYGVFADEEEWYNDWIVDYEAETDEEAKGEILSWHKENWNVVGSDVVIVGAAKRIDDKTVELTLMGNSSDIYDKSEIQIEFDGSFLLPEPFEVDGEIVDWEHTKIKMDEDGVRSKMYRSDNSVELKKQRRTGGGGGSVSYTLMFEENGGSAVENQDVRKGNQAVMPEVPEKEGYTFGGWFTDKECTKEYDFSAVVSNSLTLYAKWNENEIPEKVGDGRIILTIGETTAEVFGEEKENDVAPVLKGDRAFIPVRFVAESLGADVVWTEEEPEKVVIREGDAEIILNIGSDKAMISGEAIILDSPAFLESDRTFVPVRFVFEALGADVEWKRDEQKVIITK